VTPGPITTNYGYEYENRLTSVSNPSYTAAYTYSADGLRLRAQESNHPYPDRWFLYAGALPFCEGTLSGDTHSLCAQGRLYTSNKIYIREGLSYYDPLVFSSVGGYRRHYLYDGLGSTRQLLNDSQTVTDTYSYEAFGNLTASTGTTANPYKYVGSLGYYGPTAAGGSSLQHLGARYYLPEVGRFVTRDPIRYTTGVNVFLYAGGNPVLFVDPLGLAYIVIELGNQTLTLYHDTGKVWDSWAAQSGIPGKYAPIEPGKYRADPRNISCVTWTRPWTLLRDQEGWGPQRLTLGPTPETMKRIRKAGRTGGFFIHGGITAGTGGCVQLSNQDVEDLFNILRRIGTPIGVTVQ